MPEIKETSDASMFGLIFFGLGGYVVAAVVVAGQVIVWLRTGHWPTLTLGTLLIPMSLHTAFGEWLAAPKSWYGLHSIVGSLVDIPLWIWVVTCSAGVIFALSRDSN